MRDLTGPKGQEKSLMKRPKRKRHRPEEIVAKLRQAQRVHTDPLRRANDPRAGALHDPPPALTSTAIAALIYAGSVGHARTTSASSADATSGP